MTESHRDQIEKNRPNIIQYLNLEEKILSQLQSKKVLTSSMAARLRCLHVDDQKNSLFPQNVKKPDRSIDTSTVKGKSAACSRTVHV